MGKAAKIMGENTMKEKQVLLDNIDKIHTTEMGIDRIRKNLKLIFSFYISSSSSSYAGPAAAGRMVLSI